MNVKVTWIARLATVAVALAAVSARAQTETPDFELERLQLNPSGMGTLAVWDGSLMSSGSVRAGAAGHYEYAPLVLHRPDGFPYGILVKERATIHAVFAFTVNDWIEVNGQVPWVFFSNGSKLGDLEVPRGKEFGTPWVSARFPVYRKGMYGIDLPIRAGGELSLGLPAGADARYTNPHGASFLPRLGVGFSLGQIEGALELSALFRPEASLEPYSGSTFDRALSTWTAALALSTGGTGAKVEVTTRFARNFFAPGWGAEIQAGVRLPFSPRGPELFVEAGPGVGSLLGQPTFRIFAGLAFGGSQKQLAGPDSAGTPLPAATMESPMPAMAPTPAAPAPAPEPVPAPPPEPSTSEPAPAPQAPDAAAPAPEAPPAPKP
ncbi:MAG TPA: hypothetical protein VIG99_15705 [Myxococcaceae bacterium]|jgi:hypothetical protein